MSRWVASGTADPNDPGLKAAFVPRATIWTAPAPSGGDDGPALRSSIAAAATAGAREFRMNGDYLISSSPGLVIPAGMTVVGKAGATRIRQGWAAGLFEGFVSASGTFADTNTAVLTADTGARAAVLTVGSTASLSAGQFYMLGANRAYGDAPASTSGDDTRYRGELVRIKSVDSATQVTLHGMVRDNYAVTNGASLRAITFANGVGLVDITLHNPTPGTLVSDMLKLSFVRNFLIDGVRFEQGDGCGIHLDTCLDGQILGASVVDLTDDIGNNRYGYGVNAVRATENVTITALRAERGRHAFTTNGKTGFRGIPRNIQIVGGVSDRSNSTPWDTHVQGDAISFQGCKATNCQISAFQLRAPRTRVVNADVDFCGNGFEIAGTAHGSHVKGGSFTRLTRNEASSQGRGGLLFSAEGAVIDGNIFDGTWFESLYISGSPNNSVIRNNVFRNPGLGTSGAPGIAVDSATTATGVRILRNHFEDGQTGASALGTGNLTYAVDLAATGATGWYLADNTAAGASQAVFVRDLGTGNTSARNRHLDRAEDKTVGLAPAGAVAESYSRVGGNISTQTFLVSGRQSFVGVWLEAGQVVNTISFIAGGTAAATPTNQWFSLYSAARAKLAVTADDTTAAWGTFARKTLTLTSPYTVPSTGIYYVGINVTAATVPTIGGVGTSGSSTGLAPKLVGFDATNTGLTTPATAPATAAAFSDISVMPYVVLF